MSGDALDALVQPRERSGLLLQGRLQRSLKSEVPGVLKVDVDVEYVSRNNK